MSRSSAWRWVGCSFATFFSAPLLHPLELLVVILRWFIHRKLPSLPFENVERSGVMLLADVCHGQVVPSIKVARIKFDGRIKMHDCRFVLFGLEQGRSSSELELVTERGRRNSFQWLTLGQEPLRPKKIKVP